MNALTILALEFGAFWPVWIWWARRIAGEPESAWGLAALATAVWFAWRKGARHVPPPMLSTAMVVAYGVACLTATPIFRAAVAVAAIGLTLWSRRSLGVLGLFVIALPINASLQFVAGFPMRLAASSIAAAVLSFCGRAVAADGTGLRWSGGLVEVDVPCSGIRMLWAGLYLALAAACVYECRPWRTCAVMAAAVGAVIVGNALRTAAIFHLETGLLPVAAGAADAVHAGAGLVVFAGIACTTVLCARW